MILLLLVIVSRCAASETQDHTSDIQEGSLRLSNGTDSNQGRVEVFLNGAWGSICDNDWDLDNGQVACRQLGLPRDIVYALTAAQFGEGTGSVRLSELQCNGTEEALIDCPRSEGQDNECQHSQDAGLVCSVCVEPTALGMQNRSIITDSQITASSNSRSRNFCTSGTIYDTSQARLHSDSGWASILADTDPWIQVDFLLNVTITGILMQGNGENIFCGFSSYVESFEVQIGYDESSLKYITEGSITKNFDANTDADSVEEITFPVPVSTRYVRILPTSWFHGVALRFEIIGCRSVDECTGDMNICSDNSDCFDLNDGYQCVCHKGFEMEGGTCKNIDECSSNPCKNNATCIDEINAYTCQCLDGWNGTHCEINVDECSSSPCNNAGTCVDDINGYLCTCAEGWTGVHCENNINECSSIPCQNAGTCNDIINGYHCTCADGWTGIHCENNIDECSTYSSSPCKNAGTCNYDISGYRCTCADGWTGAHCETDLDECSSSPCRNAGTCNDDINGYRCTCAEGWTGIHCESSASGTGLSSIVTVASVLASSIKNVVVFLNEILDKLDEVL